MIARTVPASQGLAVFPRRRKNDVGVGREAPRGPVIISLEKLESYFHMPMPEASKELGICTTAIKKLCRKFGVKKWPYRLLNTLKNVNKKKTAASFSAMLPTSQPSEGYKTRSSSSESSSASSNCASNRPTQFTSLDYLSSLTTTLAPKLTSETTESPFDTLKKLNAERDLAMPWFRESAAKDMYQTSNQALPSIANLIQLVSGSNTSSSMCLPIRQPSPSSSMDMAFGIKTHHQKDSLMPLQLHQISTSKDQAHDSMQLNGLTGLHLLASASVQCGSSSGFILPMPVMHNQPQLDGISMRTCHL